MRIPLGVQVGVCGVSGSGKSSLVVDTIGIALAPPKITTNIAWRDRLEAGKHDRIEGPPRRTSIADQSRASMTSPGSYLGLIDAPRSTFAEGDALAAGLSVTDLAHGCDRCGGRGRWNERMLFLPAVSHECEACVGSGYTREAAAWESTGVYWKPVYYILEDDFECWLLKARHVRNVPGRKTDVADSAWIAQLVEHGLVRRGFVPPKEIRELRNLTRYRKAQIEERVRESQRLDKVLQDAGIKLSSVASDVLGVSSRAMLKAMIEGTRDPKVLSELAKGTLRRKIPEFQQALTGRFGSHHALLVGTIPTNIEILEEIIQRLSEQIDEVIAPFGLAVEMLRTIPGVNRRVAEALVSEIGGGYGSLRNLR